MKKYSLLQLLLFKFSFIAMMIVFFASSATANKNDVPAIIGRWDMTVDFNGQQLPSWFEVHHSGFKTLVGEFVGMGGSARPIAKVNFENNEVSFTIPPQWEPGNGDVSLSGVLQGDNITGTLTLSDGKAFKFTAVRAPSLERTAKPVWGKPIKLFNGKDLTGWHASGTNQWVAENGILKSPKPGSNIITDATFTDFKLHVEFRFPEDGNSGVYLRGRYEVQVEDEVEGQQTKEQMGAVYGFIAPSEKAGLGPNQWQTYDITLIGRMLTVVLNGKTVICNREIPGITGGALNSNEGEPGPIYFQGDHKPVEYRNIVITPAM